MPERMAKAEAARRAREQEWRKKERREIERRRAEEEERRRQADLPFRERAFASEVDEYGVRCRGAEAAAISLELESMDAEAAAKYRELLAYQQAFFGGHSKRSPGMQC